MNALDFLSQFDTAESQATSISEGDINPVKVAGAMAAQTVLTPGAGLRAAYELIKTGDLNKASAVLEKILEFPTDQLNEVEKAAAVKISRVLGAPVEMAGEGWKEIIRAIPSVGIPETGDEPGDTSIFEPIAGTLGQAAAIFAMGGRKGKAPKAEEFLKQYEGSKSLVSDAVGTQIMPPEEIMQRLESYHPGMESAKPGASSHAALIAEAEGMGMKFEGVQKGAGSIPDMPQFTDPKTKSTLLVRPGETVEAALARSREPFMYDIVNQKVEHRRVLQNLMNEGSLTKEHIIRGTDVESFRKIMENDRLVLGQTFEGESAISAYSLKPGQSFEDMPMYGSNMSDHIVMIGKSHMIEGEGMAPGEVFWNPDTPPQDITYLYKGEQYNYGDLKSQIGGEYSE
jgi:hypothetical protein